MPLLEEHSEPVVEVDVSALETSPVQRQRRQMLIALALLLAALMLVLIKDRNFWFPPEAPVTTTSQVKEPTEAIEDDSAPAAEEAKKPGKPSAGAHAKAKPQHAAVAATAKTAPATSGTAAAPTSTASAARVVLPALEVEVVAGDEHRTIRTSNPSVKVDLRPGTPVTSQAANSEPSGSGGTRVTLPPGMAEIVSRPVEPKYPLLAKQMKVQGAVVLQALIGRDGNIQGLNVLSGPQILSTAAQEAVKQWRFRPYVQSGETVESEARITVNFTISTQ
jgi:TonB family protein